LRVLVDESLPRQIAAELAGHDATTVRAQKWSGLRNGVLLRAAAGAGFEVILTADHSIRHQQNVAAMPIAVVVIRLVRNRMSDLRPLLPAILAAIETIPPGQVAEVNA
jgi:predicted nuclease of predicted toxin-antitoxin system